MYVCVAFPLLSHHANGNEQVTPHEVNAASPTTFLLSMLGVKRKFMQSLTTNPSVRATQEILKKKKKGKKTPIASERQNQKAMRGKWGIYQIDFLHQIQL